MLLRKHQNRWDFCFKFCDFNFKDPKLFWAGPKIFRLDQNLVRKQNSPLKSQFWIKPNYFGPGSNQF